jgi:alkanesulfonate monooxygenase SsuD/methylene tetrahydromethanopterin reductase-like flavin-dependent oxidoreductase (luciferase family)
VSTTSASGAERVGAHGYVQATFLTGYDGTRQIYEAYRRGWRSSGRGEDVPIDRLAYAGLVYCGRSESEAYAGGEKLLWYLNANKVPRHFQQPPGYAGLAAEVAMLKGSGSSTQGDRANFGRSMSVETAMERGILFCGTPDQVYAQLKEFYRRVGGFGHLLIMGQAGFLEHDETVLGIRTFAREVYPRLKEEFVDTTISGIVEPV